MVGPARLRDALYAAGPSGIYVLNALTDSFERVHALRLTVGDMVADRGRLILSLADSFVLPWSPRALLPIPTSPPRPPQTSGALCLQVDPQGRIWVGFGAGVTRLDERLQAVETIEVPTRMRPVDILFDPAGRMWTASRNTLAVYEQGRWRTFGVKDGLKHPGAIALALHEGAIWVGFPNNDDQFARLVPNGSGWKVESFGKQTGHIGLGARVLRVDSRGWLWRGTVDRGFQVCVTRCQDSSQWIEIGTREGMANPRIGQHTWFEDTQTQSIWAICSAGLFRLRVDPGMFTRGQNPLLWADAPVRSGRDVKIQLGSMYFQHPSAVQVRYRFAPGDRSWTTLPPSEKGGWQVERNNLSWGSYEFEAQARTGRADWYPAVQRSAFRVPFPWSVGPLAAGGGLAVSLGAYLLARRIRKGRQIRYEQLKAAAVRARELPEEERDEFLVRLPPGLGNEARALLSQADTALPEILPEEAPDDLSGLTLAGRYQVERRVGGGGFATLYRAYDLRLKNRPTAVKVIDRIDSGSWSATLDRELEILSGLRIPGLVAVFDRGVTPWRQGFLVLEFIEGITLRKAIEEGGISRGDCRRWMGELAAILDQIHAAGVVHRDLKPENLMLRDGPERSLVVIDLGVASARSRHQKSMWATQAAGSLDYMAPEQLHGVASAAADIYSFALVFVETLTGKGVGQFAANQGVSVPEAARQILEETGGSTAAEIVVRALAYAPAERQKSAGAFWRELDASLGGRANSDGSGTPC